MCEVVKIEKKDALQKIFIREWPANLSDHIYQTPQRKRDR